MGLVFEVPITQLSGDAWHMDMLTWSMGSFVRFCLKMSSIFKITHTHRKPLHHANLSTVEFSHAVESQLEILWKNYKGTLGPPILSLKEALAICFQEVLPWGKFGPSFFI